MLGMVRMHGEEMAREASRARLAAGAAARPGRLRRGGGSTQAGDPAATLAGHGGCPDAADDNGR